MSIYPLEIARLIARQTNAGELEAPSAQGRSASFECGSYVGFDVLVEADRLTGIKFTTNGCGYMVASAVVLTAKLKDRNLNQMDGLGHEDLLSLVREDTGEIPAERGQCFNIVVEAIHAAFADLRSRRVSEFRGEAALICSCFGISQPAIEQTIRRMGLRTVDEVTAATRAGTGCGSCRILIQEMLDGADML